MIYVYIWWTHPKKAMAMWQWRIIPWRSNPSACVSGAALSPSIAKIAIPAQETIELRMMPRTKTIPPSQTSSMPNRRMGKLALMNMQWMETRRMTITCPSPKTR